MTRYSVSGEVSPDCTIADTGEPAGEYNGQPYWTWEASGQTWYLFWLNDRWWIAAYFAPASFEPAWTLENSSPSGEYGPQGSATGTATVAEYVQHDEYIVVEWTASGKFTVLKKSA